jgi:hypothetical protein
LQSPSTWTPFISNPTAKQEFLKFSPSYIVLGSAIIQISSDDFDDRILLRYEKYRLKKIQRNEEYLSKLGIGKIVMEQNLCLKTEKK